MTMKIQELVERITRRSEAYYKGQDIVSDHVFNKDLNELRQLDPGNPVLHQTGWGYIPADQHRAEVKHRHHVGSIDERIKFEDVKDNKDYSWLNSILVALSKIDGASLTATYHWGKLLHVLTRGDGEVGINVTNNAVASGSIPLQIETNLEWVDVRLEGVISWQDFEGMDASHPRNKAAGLLGSIDSDPDELKKVLVVGYHIFDYDGSKLEMLDQLDKWGFIVCPYRVFQNWDEYRDAVNAGEFNRPEDNSLKNGKVLPTDGAVLVEDLDPENCVAIKYEDETAETVVREIVINATRTGRMVPVVNYDPTELSGAVLNNATCNNIAWLREMGIYEGCTIKIRRANMIIPEVLEVMNPDPTKVFELTHCPCCNAEVIQPSEDSRDAWCPNDNCPAKTWEMVYRLFDYPEIKGLGHATADQFFEHEKVEDILTFKDAVHRATFDSVNSYIGPAFSEKLMQSFECLKTESPTVYDYCILAAIPKVGDSSSWKLYEGVPAAEFIQNVKAGIVPEAWLALITTTPGRENFKHYFQRLQHVVEFFDGRIRDYEKPPEKPVAKFKYALTGRFSVTKDELSKEFEQYGAEWVDVGDADFILTNTPEKKSAKLKDAEARGVTILSEEAFREKIKAA